MLKHLPPKFYYAQGRKLLEAAVHILNSDMYGRKSKRNLKRDLKLNEVLY